MTKQEGRPPIFSPEQEARALERAKGMVDASGFSDLAAYQEAVEKARDQSLLSLAREEKQERRAELDEWNRLQDARRRLQSIGIDNPSDAMTEQNARDHEWEMHCRTS